MFVFRNSEFEFKAVKGYLESDVLFIVNSK